MLNQNKVAIVIVHAIGYGALICTYTTSPTSQPLPSRHYSDSTAHDMICTNSGHVLTQATSLVEITLLYVPEKIKMKKQTGYWVQIGPIILVVKWTTIYMGLLCG